jgi:steroid delta-isomerase-like uncharacterized protein
MDIATTQETIAKYYAAFNRRDYEGMLTLLSPDVIHDANQGGSEPGIEKFRAFLLRMDQHYSEQVEDLVVYTNPDRSGAAAEFYIRGEYLKTDSGLPEARGQKYHLRVGAFFDLTNGKISRVTNYYNLRQWIQLVSGV